LSQLDVTLVGESNLDLLLYGLPEELTVEREWIAEGMAMTLGGSPAITAHNLAALGSRVGFITPLAEDAFAGMCTRTLADAGVDLSRAVRVRGGASTGVSVLLQHEHSRRMLTYPGVTGALRFADIDLEYLGRSRHFHFSSYFLQEALRPDAARLLAWCRQAGLTTSLDTNDDPSGEWGESVLELLQHVDILMPNEREACRIAREPNPEAAVRELAARVPLLVVKRGKRGALACHGSERWEVCGVAVDVVDAVGAGDSFNAGFLHGFLREWPVEKCLEFGNLAGAYSTTALGGVEAFRNRERWQAFAAQHSDLAASPRE
jgi:sugar/nucleoside kinase (ribokinase family)